MAIDTLAIIREVYEIWHNPSTSRLTPQSVVNALNRVFAQRKLDLGLSGGNFLVKISNQFTVSESTREINLKDIIQQNSLLAIVRVEVAKTVSNITEDSWGEVLNGNFADWTSVYESSEPYYSIIGSPTKSKLRFNFKTTNKTFRLWYENADYDDGDYDLPDLFRPLLVYDTALETGLLIDDRSDEFQRVLRSKTPLLIERQSEALKRFKRWLTSRKSNAVQTRKKFNNRANNASENLLARDLKIRIGM